jgi:hypothetical protein
VRIIPSPQIELRRLLDSINRRRLLRSRLRLWCSTHQSVEEVRDVFPNREALLECGCRREIAEGISHAIQQLEREAMLERRI